MLNECIMCEPMAVYISLAESFTAQLSDMLAVPMWIVFGALVGLWLTTSGLQMVLGTLNIAQMAREGFFVCVAAGLLAGQGALMVQSVYSTAMATVGGAASMVMETALAAGADQALVSGDSSQWNGMTKLIFIAEKGLGLVLMKALNVWQDFGLGNLDAGVHGLLLALPWALLMIMYFSHVAVAVFRVMVIAGLSPFVMLGMGFGWGRGMVSAAFKALLASYMVLFGASLAVGICLYGVASIDTAYEPVVDSSDFFTPTMIVPIVLGWMGFAFTTEATGIANSLSGANFTNTSVAAMTGGIAATGGALLKRWKTGINMMRSGASGAATAFQTGQGIAADPAGALNQFQDRMNSHRQKISDRMNKPIIDKGNS